MRNPHQLWRNNRCEVEYKSYKIVLYSQVRKTLIVLIKATNLEEMFFAID